MYIHSTNIILHPFPSAPDCETDWSNYMDFIRHLSSVIACLVLLLSLYHFVQRNIHNLKNKGKSPPEPSGAWPIIGHLHLLRGQGPLARTLGGLADNIGPIFSIRLGADRALVISSREAVKECFTSKDKAFATRPPSSTGKYLGYNYAAFVFAPYGPYWREMRKIVFLELLSTKRLDTLNHLRVSEIQESMKELYSAVEKNNNNGDSTPATVVISKWFQQLALNITVKTIAGKRYTNSPNGAEDEEAKHFRRLVKEFMYAAGEFAVSDQIPFPLLRWMDFNGSIKNMKRIAKELDTIIQSWVDEHAERRSKKEDSKDQDFIDVLLSVIDDKITYGYTRETIIKATVLTIILASGDSSPTLLTWLMSLLLNNRHVMKRAQEEIDNKIGRDRWAEDSDIEKLNYLQSIIKETLRLYPPGPLLLPHQAVEDCNVGGYLISEGTHLLVNVWKLHRDARIWQEPNEFQPERFLTTHAEVDIYGHHFEYIPFGSGRRSCSGIVYAMRVVHLTIARLLQGFHFTTPSDLPVDMKEGQGLSLPKTNPLEVLITQRLPTFLYGN